MSYKILNTAVIGLLNIIGKITGGKFIIIFMVYYTFTAYTFLAAWFIATVAYSLILVYFALHVKTPY